MDKSIKLRDLCAMHMRYGSDVNSSMHVMDIFVASQLRYMYMPWYIHIYIFPYNMQLLIG